MDYISDPACSRHGVEPTELSEIAVDREEFRVLLGLLPLRLSPKENRARKWVNEYECLGLHWTFFYEIVFSLFFVFSSKVNVISK